MDLVALKAELTTDPAGVGYLPHTGDNDAANAAIINNADGTHPRTVANDNVDTGILRGITTLDAWDGLKNAAEAWYKWLTQNGVLPVNTETLSKLAGIPDPAESVWGNAEQAEMTAAMAAVMLRDGSRAEELGFGNVTPSHVAQARAV